MTIESVEVEMFREWIDFLEAIRNDEIKFEEGAYARVVYDSSYSDAPQTIKGEVQRISNSMGRPFRLSGKLVKGWHVQSLKDGHEIGHVESIEWEVADQ